MSQFPKIPWTDAEFLSAGIAYLATIVKQLRGTVANRPRFRDFPEL